jgi:serine/threonine protein kinase
MKTPERHQQIKAIVMGAIGLRPNERAAYLDRVCAGDASLRAEAENLLAREGHVSAFIEVSPFAEVETTITWKDRLLGERYLIEGEIGRGGMGVVLLARDQKLNQTPVVIKLLLDEIRTPADQDWIRQKFKLEIDSLARIHHPNVVRPLDVGQSPFGQTYFVMQYVPGANLRSIMTTDGLPLDRTAHLIQQIGRGLAAVHAQGIVHRDLKPENILLQTDGDEEHAKLIDFGIASVFDPVEQAGIKTTRFAGTPDYMAPEQLQCKPTAASDIYALGVIAYEIVTGRRPFKADSQVQLLDQQRAGVRHQPRDLRPDLPEAAQSAILKALAFDQNDRYASAKDFGDDLARALTKDVKGGSSQRIKIDSFTSHQNNDDGKKKWSRVIPAGLVLLIGLIALSAYLLRDRIDDKPQFAEVLSYNLQRKDGTQFTSNEALLPGEQFYLNFKAARAGYLYIVLPGENGKPQAALTAQPPKESGLSSNRIEANTVFQYPKNSVPGFWLDKETFSNTFTIIFSPTLLEQPRFLNQPGAPELDAAAWREFLGLRQRLEAQPPKLETRGAETWVALPTDAASGPVLFDLTVRRK